MHETQYLMYLIPFSILLRPINYKLMKIVQRQNDNYIRMLDGALNHLRLFSLLTKTGLAYTKHFFCLCANGFVTLFFFGNHVFP